MNELKNKPVHPMQWRKEGHYGETWYDEQFGITLRQHYAGLAMAGQVASGDFKDPSCAGIAKWSVAYADALIAELEKTEQ